MTTSTPHGELQSEGTLSCLTGAIVLREGARAVGSTFAREWDSDPAPPLSPTPPETPSSLRALPVLPTPTTPAVLAPLPKPRRSGSRRALAPSRRTSLPCSIVGAFALGATIAALAGVGVERGALEVAALSSAVAGGITLAAALARLSGKGHAGREGD